MKKIAKHILLTMLMCALPSLSALAANDEALAANDEDGNASDSTATAEVKAEDRSFAIEKISDAVYERMRGKSYKTGCTIPLDELRYLRLRHYTAAGIVMEGELVCHKDIAADLIDIFRKLYAAHYPIERIRLIDDYDADDVRSMNANNTSCFNYRHVAGSRNLSNHSRGRAIDINPFYNPYVKTRNGQLTVSPPSARKHANRAKTNTPYGKIDHNDLCYRLFKEHGFRWGGDWRTLKDYQHFEK